ncbi:MAG: hypothetical protein AAB909_01035 [Patescibacteria group bacterium]
MTKRFLPATLIILLGLTLRIYDFGRSPQGVYVDEAAIGYNAYSFLKTGKDESGKTWPVFMRYFGDYAPSLYTYLTTVPVRLFDLNIYSVRTTSLVAGVLLVAIAALYINKYLGLVIAISPVFVFFSRAAFESNLALTLLILGIVLGLRSRHLSSFLPLSFIILALSSYAYHAERVVSPIMTIYFAVIYWKKHTKLVITSLIIYGLLSIPLFVISFTAGGSDRAISLLTASPIRNYMVYFSPDNLFSKPDPDPQRSFPELSVFYWWMAPLLLIGLTRLSKIPKIYLLLLFTAIIPGAITKDYFSSLRVLPAFVVLSYIISQAWPKNKLINIFLLIIATFELYSNLVLLKHERASVWNSEYAQIAQFISQNPDKKIVLDNSRLTPSYILIAFHNRVDPRILQAPYSDAWLSAYYTHTDFENNRTVDNVEVRPIHWQTDIYKDQILIGDSLAISDSQVQEHGLTLIKKEANFQIYQTSP